MDHGVARVVGEQSFGKGLVQDIFPLPDGSAIRVTVATYFTPNGTSIHGYGIEPHYIVEMDEALSARVHQLTLEEDIQLQKALEVMAGLRQE
jgi:carboxyl-terminal processing protease